MAAVDGWKSETLYLWSIVRMERERVETSVFLYQNGQGLNESLTLRPPNQVGARGLIGT